MPALTPNFALQSFVTKVRSRVSSTFSKWFGNKAGGSSGAVVRQRPDDEDDDEEAEHSQPPAKRPKLPSYSDNSVFVSDNNNFLNLMPGPSGLQSRKPFDNTTLLNGDKESDSGESTSGYSSMARITKSDNVHGTRKIQTLFGSFLAVVVHP